MFQIQSLVLDVQQFCCLFSCGLSSGRILGCIARVSPLQLFSTSSCGSRPSPHVRSSGCGVVSSSITQGLDGVGLVQTRSAQLTRHHVSATSVLSLLLQRLQFLFPGGWLGQQTLQRDTDVCPTASLVSLLRHLPGVSFPSASGVAASFEGSSKGKAEKRQRGSGLPAASPSLPSVSRNLGHTTPGCGVGLAACSQCERDVRGCVAISSDAGVGVTALTPV